MSAAEPVLDMRGVDIVLDGAGANRRVTHGIDLALHRGRTVALVGESGCGKSVTGLAAMNLLTRPLRVAAGAITLQTDTTRLDLSSMDPLGPAMQKVRGRHIAMVFQDPMTALDPVYPVGEQIAEALRHHLGLSRSEASVRAVELLRMVRIPAPEKRAREYPFQLSGGMRQRVMIAIAIACRPAVLIADEPTTALDVTVQAQILAQLRDLGRELGLAMLLITHDLGVVAETADEVLVMYRGQIVERASVDALFEAPSHPYTLGLLASLPPLGGERRPLTPIAGQVPPLGTEVPGCPFADRCAKAWERCRRERPQPIQIAADHSVSCFLFDESGARSAS